jgi:hypothetical protein
MVLQTAAVALQWLSNDHVATPTDTKATLAQQQKNCVFCAVRAECYKQDKLVFAVVQHIMTELSGAATEKEKVAVITEAVFRLLLCQQQFIDICKPWHSMLRALGDRPTKSENICEY